MMRDLRTRFGGVAVVGVLSLLGVACGQKPWVAEEFERQLAQTGGFVDPATGQVFDESGRAVGPGTGSLGGGGSATGGTSGTAGTEGTEGTAGTAGHTEDAGSGDVPTVKPAFNDPNAPAGGVKIGVTDSLIKIGFHAPLTGAAPVPSDSVQKGKDLFFRHFGKVVHFRTVDVILKDDRYNPSSAVAVCKEMVQNDKVFLLSGAAGTDQIAACAKYANSVGVPYLSAGVTEAGLSGLSTYFATTMTYPDQGPYLADYLSSDLGAKGEENGMLWFNTASFQDAHSAFVSAMNSRGMSLAYDQSYSKGASEQDAITAVQQMKARGIDNVYVLTSPFWFLKVLSAARSQDYSPQWVGVGITMTFDTVASAGCRGGTLTGAKFFSPFPAWVDRNKFDPNFAKAVAKHHPEENGGDDFMWLSWAFSKVGTSLLKLPGSNLTRERFIYYAERSRGIRSGIFPPLSFSPSDRFGSTQVHVNEAQCSGYKAGDNRWHTIASFVSNF